MITGRFNQNPDTKYLHFYHIPKGVQAVIRIEGCDSGIIIQNPDSDSSVRVIMADPGKQNIVNLPRNKQATEEVDND